jgi:hypothetical protein
MWSFLAEERNAPPPVHNIRHTLSEGEGGGGVCMLPSYNVLIPHRYNGVFGTVARNIRRRDDSSDATLIWDDLIRLIVDELSSVPA